MFRRWCVTSTTSSSSRSRSLPPQHLVSLATAQRVIDDFGLVVNTAKTDGPAQRITFLGILLDSTEQTLACTTERLREIRSLIASALSDTDIRLTALLPLIVKLQLAASVHPGARPLLRRVMD